MAQKTTISGKASSTIRREKELADRFDAVAKKLPYRPSIAATMRRGFILALEELERHAATTKRDR